MKTIRKISMLALAILVSMMMVRCSDDDEPVDVDPGESSSELLVKKFDAAPTLDGEIDEMWASAKRLVSTTEVPSLDARQTYLNSGGQGIEEDMGFVLPLQRGVSGLYHEEWIHGK